MRGSISGTFLLNLKMLVKSEVICQGNKLVLNPLRVKSMTHIRLQVPSLKFDTFLTSKA